MSRLRSTRSMPAPLRQAALLDSLDHRPWPLPERPWLLAETFGDVLLAHWRVPALDLERLVPTPLALDLFDGEAWLGISAARVGGVRLRGTLPVPRLSSFLQLAVQTYVTAEGRPGIFPFSLDASSALVAEVTRRIYGLPLHRARMSAERRGEELRFSSIRRGSPAPPIVFDAGYRAGGPAITAEDGSLEHFLVERYRVYAVDLGGALLAAELHGLPWSLRPAEAEIGLNTLEPPGLKLGEEPAALHLADRHDLLVWPLEPAAAT